MKIFNIEIDRQRFYMIAEILLLFFCFFMPIIFTSPETSAESNTEAVSISMINYILTAIPQVLLLIYIIWIRKDIALKNFGITFPVPRDFLFAFGHALALFVLIMIISTLVQLLPEGLQEFLYPESEIRFEGRSNGPIILLFSLTTGYREELFFRSYLLTRFRQLGIPIRKAVVIGAILFGLMHLYQGLFGFILTSLIAVYLSIVFLKTRSLNMIALAHALFNALQLLFLTNSG